MGKLTIVDPLEGNVEFMWDAGNEQEVEVVREAFGEYIGQRLNNLIAFRRNSGRLEVITTFDKDAEQILVLKVPPVLSGG